MYLLEFRLVPNQFLLKFLLKFLSMITSKNYAFSAPVIADSAVTELVVTELAVGEPVEPSKCRSVAEKFLNNCTINKKVFYII